jgi:hypothetical protein
MLFDVVCLHTQHLQRGKGQIVRFQFIAGPAAAGSSRADGDSTDGKNEWEEERVALQAIYGADMQTLGPLQTLITVNLHGTCYTLDFRILSQADYPSQPPLIGVRYSNIAARHYHSAL